MESPTEESGVVNYPEGGWWEMFFHHNPDVTVLIDAEDILAHHPEHGVVHLSQKPEEDSPLRDLWFQLSGIVDLL